MKTVEIIKEVAKSSFLNEGYGPVSLRDIAVAAGIKTPSLYHHFPGGKDELFYCVINEKLETYSVAVTEASNKESLREALLYFSNWYLNEQQMNMTYLSEKDLPKVSQSTKKKILSSISVNIFVPFRLLFEHFDLEIREGLPFGTLCNNYMTLLSGVPNTMKFSRSSAEDCCKDLVDFFMTGIARR